VPTQQHVAHTNPQAYLEFADRRETGLVHKPIRHDDGRRRPFLVSEQGVGELYPDRTNRVISQGRDWRRVTLAWPLELEYPCHGCDDKRTSARSGAFPAATPHGPLDAAYQARNCQATNYFGPRRS
jgi:hypothetical protein